MRLILLTTMTMLAFAANSVLNRAALAPDLGADRLEPWAFAAIRLLSGALCLMLLIGWRDKRLQVPAFKFWGVISLSLYAVAFSLAYISLPTGIGALILFGVIQLVMFAGALIKKEHLTARKWIGALIAFAGLVWLLWPTQHAAIDPWGAALMLAAGIGWGVYSLLGRASLDALADTGANFFLYRVFCGGRLISASCAAKPIRGCSGGGVRRGDFRNGLRALVFSIAAFIYCSGGDSAVKRAGLGSFRRYGVFI